AFALFEARREFVEIALLVPLALFAPELGRAAVELRLARCEPSFELVELSDAGSRLLLRVSAPPPLAVDALPLGPQFPFLGLQLRFTRVERLLPHDGRRLRLCQLALSLGGPAVAVVELVLAVAESRFARRQRAFARLGACAGFLLACGQLTLQPLDRALPLGERRFLLRECGRRLGAIAVRRRELAELCGDLPLALGNA